jgi:hypothetical protein
VAAGVRQPDVAIYDEDGANLLRGATGGQGIKNLSFSSALPGGFSAASFRLERPTVRHWPGRAGLKVVIRRGLRTLWWGWIEDVQRAQRGRIEEISVTCLGPWQVLLQRLTSPTYSGTLYGQQAIAVELESCCPELSGDYARLDATGVNIAPLTWSNQPVADLVRLVCDAGDASGRAMLFAVWEPSGAGRLDSAIGNPGFEIGTGGWSIAVGGNNVTWASSTADYHGGFRSLRAAGNGPGTTSATQTGVPCAAATNYTVEYWAKIVAAGGNSNTIYFTLRWYNSGGGQIGGTVTGISRSSTTTTAWVRYAESVASPAGAVTYTIALYATVGGVSGNEIYADDVAVYAGLAPDAKPRARLWPRDLSAADCRLYTADMDAALPVDETTRELANYVLASYGSPASYTAAGQDAGSQADYRRRDAVVAAGDASSAGVAAAMRDAYLARYAEPGVEPGAWRLVAGSRALRTAHGARVWPEDLRAGDRVRIADGPAAGTVVLLTRVEYADGVVSATPERLDDVPMLLARRG